MNFLVGSLLALVSTSDGPPSLGSQLAAEGPSALATAARSSGDARRGALMFFRPGLACARCHLAEAGSKQLGPDLANPIQKLADSHLVESILEPSKLIRPGYEAVTIARKSGEVLTGLVDSEDGTSLTLRDPAGDGRPISIPRDQIEERKSGGSSLMPAGLVEQLANRQEFLDLVRYLIEIGEGGPDRARQLRPTLAELNPALPAYESELDHAGLIAELGPESLRRGEAIYERVCANCHGTNDKPGSLPTSLRFASGTFKNGFDPYRMYRTLTHGSGQMTAQTWMVPRQKYDVIHYIRETYLKADNPSQYARVDRAYLDGLPKGTSRGPAPSSIEAWSAMDYGPTLTGTFEVGDDGENFAYKGVAIRLDPGPGGVSRGKHWAVFEHDTLRLAAAWEGDGFIDWNGINFNGRHGIHPRVAGLVRLANPTGPGWANPVDGSFADPRPLGRDGKAYGPLPRTWAHYRGQYRHGERVVMSYTVGETPILESPGLELIQGSPVLTRTFRIATRPRDLVLQVARRPGSTEIEPIGPDSVQFGATSSKSGSIVASASPTIPGLEWITTEAGDLRLKIPEGREPIAFTLKIATPEVKAEAKHMAAAMAEGSTLDLVPLTRGGPARWPEVLKTTARIGESTGPFAVDVLPLPDSNPWLCLVRATGLDFTSDGRGAFLCSWDGDVWKVDGLDNKSGELSWRRIASGLFQPLGLKLMGRRVLIGCRDQIVILNDLNGDGEADFYENFNSDHQVTEHFHEFAMDLQSDADGNLYYAKGARHGLKAVVPHHGTLLKVAADGSKTEILATGFRAPNGVRVNGDGTFFLTDQEGFWMPKNRINWVKPGGFYGNLWGFTDVTDPADSAMEPPVCWITNAVDRSPAEVIQVEGAAWGPLGSSLLNLSYGEGKIYVIPHEVVGGRMQGGVSALPILTFPTGVMRGRFGPVDGQLYACGMFAWAGNRTEPGGFYRIRATGKPIHVPVGLNARAKGMQITFSGPLDPSVAADPSRYQVKTWSLRRSARYGSDHVDERPSKVLAARPTSDGLGVFLEIEGFQPVQCMEIRFGIRGRDGERVEGSIDNSVGGIGK